MPTFWEVVRDVIKQSDVLLEVLDARFPLETRNKEVEDKIQEANKKIIYILNKSDLLKEKIDDINFNLEPHVFISAKNNLGTTKLRRLLATLIPKDRPLIVGIVGYPNTGKSSLINVLKQKKSAQVSSVPGMTRGLQKVKISPDIYLLDTPGVFPYKEKNEEKHSLINVKDYRKIEDPEVVALSILEKAYEKNPKAIEELYGVKPKKDSEVTLEEIAFKYKWLVKGGKPNLDLTSRKIIQDWQRGKLIV